MNRHPYTKQFASAPVWATAICLRGGDGRALEAEQIGADRSSRELTGLEKT